MSASKESTAEAMEAQPSEMYGEELDTELVNIQKTGTAGTVDDTRCVGCKADKPKYKCPKCYLKYCSIPCCKSHKTDGSCPVKLLQRISKRVSKFEAPNLHAKLDELLEKFKTVIKNQHLQQWINLLESCTSKEADFLYDIAMLNPEFLEYAQLIAQIGKGDESSDSEFQVL